jgi:hypothetical protein
MDFEILAKILWLEFKIFAEYRDFWDFNLLTKLIFSDDILY